MVIEMKIFKYFLLFVIVFGAVYYYLQVMKQDDPKAKIVNQYEKLSNKILTKDDFRWGINVNLTPTDEQNITSANQVLDLAKDLGADIIRVGGPVYDVNYFPFLGQAIDSAREKGLEVELIIGHDNKIIDGPDPELAGYKLGKQIAQQFKGKIEYYQLGNELATYALKPSWGGDYADNYIDDKMEKSLAWLKGISEAIHEVDPDAQRVATGHSVMYYFWQEAINRNIGFEVIGWDWHGDILPIVSINKFEVDKKPYDLVGKLSSMGKKLWIQESGANGALVGYDNAAQYLANYAQEIYLTPQFDGFFGFTLTDEIHQAGEKGWNKGLVALQKDASAKNGYKIGVPRSTYKQLQKVILEIKSGKIKPPERL